MFISFNHQFLLLWIYFMDEICYMIPLLYNALFMRLVRVKSSLQKPVGNRLRGQSVPPRSARAIQRRDPGLKTTNSTNPVLGHNTRQSLTLDNVVMDPWSLFRLGRCLPYSCAWCILLLFTMFYTFYHNPNLPNLSNLTCGTPYD